MSPMIGVRCMAVTFGINDGVHAIVLEIEGNPNMEWCEMEP